MSAGQYLFGVVYLTAAVAPLALGAWRLRPRLLPRWSGAPARLAEAVIVLGALVAVEEALGAAGAFKRVPVLVACVACGLGLALVAGRTAPARETDAPAAPQPSLMGVMLAVAATALVFAAWTPPVAATLDHGMTNVDTLGYHGPFAARFVQDASVTGPIFTWGEPSVTYFPANSELVNALGILAFKRDILSPLTNYGWLALALLGGWCIGRPRGAGPVTLLAVAVVLGSPVLAITQPGEPKNDIVLLALLLAAVALLLNGRDRLAPIALAGVAAGLAIGVKITAVAPAAALTLMVFVCAPRAVRARAAAVWLGALIGAGAFWYVRNLVEVGNPIPWLRSLGPIGLPSVKIPNARSLWQTVADYATDGKVWDKKFLPGLHDMLGPAWPAVLVALVGGALLSVRSGRPASHRALGVVALLSACAYVVTPASAGPHGFFFAIDLRYLTPALVVGLPLIPLLPGLQSPQRARLVLAGLAALLVASQFAPDLWSGDHKRTALAVGLAALAVAGAVGVASRRPIRREVLAAGTVAVLGACVAFGWARQDSYLRNRYRHAEGILSPFAGTYRYFQGIKDSRVAVVGTFLQYPLFGSDLSNPVRYIGRRLPHGDFAPIRSCGGFRRAVADGRFRYLVVTGYGAPFVSGGTLRELAWVASDRAATVVLKEARATVFRIERPLDPAGCPRS